MSFITESPNDLIDTSELARRTRTGCSTWAKRRMTGDTPKFIKIGRSVRYSWRDVQNWLAEQSRSSTSEAPNADAA